MLFQDRDVSKSFLSSIDSVSSVLLNKTEANQTVELSAKGLKVAMKRASANGTDGKYTQYKLTMRICINAYENLYYN